MPSPPPYDHLLRVMLPTSALLYRLIWRLSRSPEHGCRLPLREIAGRLRVAPSTVLLHLRALVRAGYVTDLTPGQRHAASHLYAISGKPVQAHDPRLWVFRSSEKR